MSSSTPYAGVDPASYDNVLGPVLFEPYAEDLAERIAPDLIEGPLLELACGTGILTAHLCSRPGFTIVASDADEDMLNRARQKLSGRPVQWQLADAMSLPFMDACFSGVICQFGFMFFSDKEKAFAEAWRVLKPGGRILFNTWDRATANPRSAIVPEAMRRVVGTNAPDMEKKGPYSFFDAAEISRLLDAAGFRQTRIEAVRKTGVYGDASIFAKGLIDGSPLVSYLKRLAKPEANRIRRAILDALLEQESIYGRQVPMQALVCEGLK
ncbi:MAG TPA: methyltransferase domain-containing protein [Flavisolibacter sp.]|nr:methyltransferase domain-containing protein [Flavisolibacter sp.]